MNTIERVIKRTFDFWLALGSLIFFSPIIAIIAILIRREEPEGDVIFRQERIGYKGISSARCGWMPREMVRPSSIRITIVG